MQLISRARFGLALGALLVVPAVASATPIPNFTFLPDFPEVGQTVNFDSSSSTPTPTKTIIVRNWDYDNNGTTDFSTPLTTAATTFPTPGTKPVKLTVADNAPSSASIIKNVKIYKERARVSWDSAADIDLHVWQPNGTEATFDKDNIPDGHYTGDETGPTGTPERFIDATTAQNRPLTIGICKYSGPSANVTTVVNDAVSGQRTFNNTLAADAAEATVAVSPANAAGAYSPPAGWCAATGAAPAVPVTPPVPPAAPAPVPAPPSNVFSFIGSGFKANKDGSLNVNVNVPGPGSLNASAVSKQPVAASARKKKKAIITIGSASAVASKAGPISMVIKPSAAARRVLKKRSLNATLSVTFKPNGGTAATQTRTVSFKKIAKKKKRKK